MKILAFDPGGTTGWAMFEIQYDNGQPQWEADIRKHFKVGQIGENAEHHKALWQLLMKQDPNTIVCERFDNRGNEFAKLIPREYIGILKLYCALFNRDYFSIGADQAKLFMTEDKLIRLRLRAEPSHQWRHANDAMRHLLHFMIIRMRDQAPELGRPLLRDLRFND